MEATVKTSKSTKKVSKIRHKNQLKRSQRHIRRKRSKLRYYKTLKGCRNSRKLSELCAEVSVVDITGMDWVQTKKSSCLLDVTEWHKQDQIAYWKSRAISLEFENRMLQEHIRHIYASQIQAYEEVDNSHETKAVLEKKTEKVIPNLPKTKERLEEMKRLYGEEAMKIMGMETAMQLNYERNVEQTKPVLWPNLPLKL